MQLSDEELAAFLDGNVSQEEVNRILSALPHDSEAMEILSLSTEIDRRIEASESRLLPMRALAAANPENLCSFHCEVLILQNFGFDIDHWSLLEEAKANNWVRDEGTPLHQVGKLLELKGIFVERKYDTTYDELEKAADSGKEVIVIVDQHIIEGVTSSPLPAYHAIYVRRATDDCIEYLNAATLQDERIGKELFLRAWRASGNYMVCASKEANGYNPQPIDVSDIDLDASLEELTEAIAENAHDIWARARLDEGWTYGPVRNDHLKRHPDLVPYSLLPDSEKEYDRLMAMNTLRLVRRLGFDITNTLKS